MKMLLSLLFLVSPIAALAVDQKNEQGFQAARQFTSEAMNETKAFGGKVVEVIDVSNYTYVQFTHGENKLWLATAKTAIKKGDLVSFVDSQPMHKFHSKTLNRTFDEIYFVNEVEVKR